MRCPIAGRGGGALGSDEADPGSPHEARGRTQLQHVLLGLLCVEEELLEEGVGEAVGDGWRLHLYKLPVPEIGRASCRERV